MLHYELTVLVNGLWCTVELHCGMLQVGIVMRTEVQTIVGTVVDIVMRMVHCGIDIATVGRNRSAKNSGNSC